jgi:ABC-2 type transport system ATP-binding protein
MNGKATAAGIETSGLVREFKNGPRAVDGIDLRVEPGEIYGFLGPNGAGKSTTVLMLTTLLPPTAGSATVAGHDIVHDGPAVRAAIGAALQEAALDPLLTGREHMRRCTACPSRRPSSAATSCSPASVFRRLLTARSAATRAG